MRASAWKHDGFERKRKGEGKGMSSPLSCRHARLSTAVALRDSRDKKRRAVEKLGPSKGRRQRGVFYLADALSAGMRTPGTRVHAHTRE